MKYLIDTDWIIHYLHGNEKVVSKLTSFRKEGLAISVISLAEVYEGVYNSRDYAASEQGVKNFVEGVSILDVDEDVCKIFARERARLRKQGQLIDNFDLLIASTALYRNLTLLTNNQKHFKEIKGLKIISI